MSEGVAAGRRTQEERRSEAERRLGQAAAKLVGEIGPARVTLANVGERAGYSRGLATHHFGSKGALMQRLVDAVTLQFRDAIFDQSQSHSAMDEGLGLVSTYFQVMSNMQPVNRARLALWADAVATGSPETRPAMLAADREFRDAITKTLERGVAAGEFPASLDPSGLATVIIAMLRGVALQSLLDDQVDLDACRAEIEQLLTGRLQLS